MFLQSVIRIYLNRKLWQNWLINMRTQSFQRDENYPNKHKASLLAFTPFGIKTKKIRVIKKETQM